MAFPRKADVDRNYVELMKVLLERGDVPRHRHARRKDHRGDQGVRPRAATSRAAPSSSRCSTGSGGDLQRRLVAEGYPLRLYVPFGRAWYPYFMRRLAERPANVLFLARNLLP